MAELVKSQIEKQGKINLCILKGILLGGPGVGKTTTLLRLLGRLLNLSECTNDPTSSTGIEKPQIVHLGHQQSLYHDAQKLELMIQKEWKSLSLDDMMGILLYYLSNPPAKTIEGSNNRSEQKKVQMSETHSQIISNEAIVPLISKEFHSKKLKKSPHESEFQEIEDLIKISKWREAHQMLEGVMQPIILHITDTGGQPEFFEILPLLMRGPSLSLIFLNLTQPFNDKFDVVFRHSDLSTPLVKYASSYTPKDMVHQVLASIESLNQSNQRSAAFLIGTHRDLVSENVVEAFEVEIKVSLSNTSFYKNDILRGYLDQCEQERLVFPIDNKKGKREEVNHLQHILTDTIRYLFKPEPLPTSWAFFHLLLRHTFEDDGICSLEQAVKIAGCSGVHEQDEVKKVLQFFYVRFGTIFYFDDVPALENLVICDPNLIFQPITKLIAVSFGANPQEPHRSEEIRKTGEIAWDFFERICEMDEKAKKLGTRKIVELLKHLHLITEIHNGGVRLFMSCLLHPYPSQKLNISKEELSSKNPAPLFFSFSTGYQPISLFHVLLSHLLSKIFLLHEKRYKNRVLLYYRTVKVEIISTSSNLEIRMNKVEMCKEVLDLLKTEIGEIMEEIPHMKHMDFYISFYCPMSLLHSSASDSVHLAKLQQDQMPFSEFFLCCSECESSMKLEMKHKIWFEVCARLGYIT